jgi:hypothetical protein
VKPSREVGQIAYVDESARSGPAGLYVVTAVVVASGAADDAREALRGLLLPGQRRLHWRDERPGRRAEIIEVVARLRPLVLVYAARPTRPRGSERSRSICITRLCWDLKELDIERLVIEERDDPLNARDRRTIANARRTGHASGALAFEFRSPRHEPLLWLPDAVAGAVAMDLAGDGSHHVKVLPADLVHLVHLTP